MTLYICSGNTCRSFMAQAIHESIRGKGTAASAGLAAVSGSPANPKAVLALQEMDIPVPEHVARLITLPMLEEADEILCMERWQADALTTYFPTLAYKVFALLPHAINQQEDVVDPFGGTMEEYLDCANLLMNAVDALINGYTEL